MDLNNLKWSCMVCNETRPDIFISVYTEDVSTQHNLPAGTMKMNVRYCNDKESCIAGAKVHPVLTSKL